MKRMIVHTVAMALGNIVSLDVFMDIKAWEVLL